jgi:hypothetical protein
VGALLFGALTIYCWIMASRTLDAHVTDVMAMLVLLKFFFFFAITGVSFAMAVVCALVSFRCWRPS